MRPASRHQGRELRALRNIEGHRLPFEHSFWASRDYLFAGGWPSLKPKTLYKSEDGKTYEYLGGGKLKELSTTEAADRIIEKYNK